MAGVVQDYFGKDIRRPKPPEALKGVDKNPHTAVSKGLIFETLEELAGQKINMSLWIPLAPMNPHYVNHYTVSIPLGSQHRYPAAHRLADRPEAMRVRLFDKDHLKRARRRKAGPRLTHTPFERTPATHVVASSATIEYRMSGIKAGDKAPKITCSPR
ncbi:hypothetical protein ARMGADRAFT_1086583 [Armillaria gallica]|uniref:Uncharacterized protein n=1 Tax=Armillaria gallica TaxID=47427 RepID=A0A2H3DBF6_ARMGA|nr:hypothetical protein ARMGADRAFT_1086583 [Armillaria gallica]